MSYESSSLLAAAIAALCGGLTMTAAHYTTPRLIGRNLKRWEAYILGVLFGILLPFAAWCVVVNDWLPLAALAIITFAAGAFTLFAYFVDSMNELKAKARGK